MKILPGIDAQSVFDVVWDPERWVKYDQNCTRSYSVENARDFVLKYGEYPGVWPVATRGAYVLARHYKFMEARDKLLMVSKSIFIIFEKPRCTTVPDSKKRPEVSRVGVRSGHSFKYHSVKKYKVPPSPLTSLKHWRQRRV